MTTVSNQEELDFLAHFGVKGMKWGVRKDTDGGGDRNAHGLKGKPSRAEILEGRKEWRGLNKTEKQIMRQSRQARTPEEAKIAADRYKKEVVNKLQSDDFKSKYQNANTMTKGELLAHVAIYNVWAPLAIASTNSRYANNRKNGPKEMDRRSKEILEEMRR